MASTDRDILPSYNTLLREDERVANNTNDRRRRHTIITLREIYYPSDCPCHSKEKKSDKKGKRKQQQQIQFNQFRIEHAVDMPLMLGHARPTMTQRSSSQSSGSSTSNSNTLGGSRVSETRLWDSIFRRPPARCRRG
ncbi:hypothetical protein LTR41_011792 [Exophiala xenobiotica]|nr:hypothetical protein LTR41_011792 [Exophiala xenobiotica]KAK5550356.1 hypothetical protein LTR46_011643 [Exophiala xenobiotica]